MATMMAVGYLFVFLLFITFACFDCKQTPTANAISCYVCSNRKAAGEAGSSDSDGKYCFDPFHPVNSTYEQHCKMTKEGHIGQFPAHYCVKITGHNEQTKEELVVRMCSITSMDNQCGSFKFDNETLRGCILTCNKDGCNSSQSIHQIIGYQFSLIMLVLLGFSGAVTLWKPRF